MLTTTLQTQLFWFELILSIVLGVLHGGYVAVAAWRMPHGRETLYASRCPACNTLLGIWAMMPGIAWILCRGQCRFCKSPISIRYMLMEWGTALPFLLVFLSFGMITPQSLLLTALALALTIIFMCDIESRFLPNQMLIMMVIVALLYAWVVPPTSWLTPLGALVGLGALAFAFFTDNTLLRNLGKFLGCAGLWLSLPAWGLFALFSLVLGALAIPIWGRRHIPVWAVLSVSLFATVLLTVTPTDSQDLFLRLILSL